MSFEAKDYCVLVVDDEVDYAEITARMLGIEGFKTIVAHSGKQAIEALKGQHIDAIISDVRMPEGDGLSVLESVKAGSFGHVKAFAFITGFSDYPTEELLKKGADTLFPKPVDIQDISLFLRETLSARATKAS